MKKPTFSKNLLAVLILLLSLQSFGQVLKTFAKRYDVNVKGDILVIGNNILNRDYGTTGNRANDSYDDLGSASVYNESINLKWINVDPDGGNNINSSSANLSIPSASQACYEIAYAGLYWSGTYTTANRSAITTVRLKTPTTGYKTLTGTVIYDYVGNSTANSARNPYACFVDITTEVKAAKEGTYTLGNIASSEGGKGTSAGHSSGWSIFVIYVDPKLPSKYITSYDGFTRIKSGDPAFTFPINGFKTIPSGSVKAKFAFAALEGDNKDNGDAMTIKGNTIAGSATGRLYCALRPASTGTTNFFNSTINDGDAYFLNRNPKSKNTFGYDTGVLDLPNSGNTVIKNDETGADITLSTSNDWYYLFFTALAVEVIEPKVVLTKTVQDAARADIGGQTVALGTALYYEIGYKNVGNDNVGTVDKNGNTYTCVLKDVLPENVNFNLADIDLSNSGGATLKSYDAATRTLLFNIPNTSLTANGATEYKIRLKVQVVSDCSELKNACTNSIDNSADITYVGVYNKAIVNDLSLNSYSGCSFTPKASNFLVNVAPCVYKQEIPYCGNQITIVAKSGYQSYSWSSSPTGTPVLQSGPSNTYTTSTPGTYYVNDITNIVPCKSIQEEIKVTDIKAIPNPILEYAKAPYRGTIDICTIGGKELPKFFLCGATDHRQIITNYGLGSTALWQKLDENSCATPVALPGKECANENPLCQWNTVGTNKDFDAKDAGQYKVTFSFAGGCALVYYFNVYKNDLNPTVEKENEFCTTKGYIKIKNVPSTGYEFSLDSGAFQDSPDFLSVVAGNHNVQIRLKAAGAASCDFTINNIDITKNAMVVAVNNLVHPKCSTDKGSFTVQAQNVRGSYTFELYLGATLVQSATVSGIGGFNSYDFTGKDPGNYTLITKTSDGCYDSRSVIINAPAVFTATANITKALTCVDGEITVTTNGGVPKYYYFVNSTTVSQNTPTIAVTNPGGTYNITVRDGNDCKYDIPAITVTATPKPEFTVKPTNILCYGSNTGVITFDVTSNTGAYILKYSIDGGANYYDNPVFSNLVGNTVYSPKLKYTLSGVDCIDTLPNITLTQPATALTASAGVSELAGCGPNKEGKIRITNPQGGTPFPAPNLFLYSFDNQATWITANDAYKAPGTYTVYIKDVNGCIFAMPGIIIDPEPVAPIIGSAPVIVYACDGKATSTVTVTNPASAIYDYTYSIDGTLNTPPTSNVFTGITAGDHTIRVNYILKSVSTFSNLLNENFGYGDDTTSPGINTAFYCFERQVAATQCKGSTAINDGDYSVTAFIVNPFGAWIQSGDHTAPTSPVTPKGRSLVVNIGDQIATSDILYQKVINNIIPNQPINFEFYAKNLLKTGNTQVDADLRVALVDAAGNEISWFATGGIPKTQNWEKYPNTAITLDPGANTTLKFIIRSNKRETSGNDVAIDDIRVYQLPKACVNFKDISVKISDNQGFSAQVTGSSNISCATGADGTITISAQNFDTTAGFQYSKDGSTWLTSTTSPVTLSNLGAGTYTPQVRFNTGGACTLTLPAKTIIAPAPIVVNTTQTLATCFPNGGATVDATGTVGGTGAYTIQLRDIAFPFTVTNFPATGILTNVAPGSYTVLVTDAKGCTPSTNPTITIAAPANPTAIIDPTSNLCFDSTTGASIVVRVTGGVGLYSYTTTFNGGTPSASSPTFAGPTFTYNATVIGTYSFDVYDSKGCKATTISQVINDKLTANTAVLPGLDCDVAPGNEAVITGTISGGTAPFVVTLLPSGSSVTSSGTTFTYSTAVAGTYNFQIKDANNCVTTIDGTINSLVPVTGSVTKAVDPTCFDGTDGQIQLSGGGGSGSGYEFNFNGAGFSTTSLYTGLNAKTTTATTTVYSYQIKDSNGCLSTTYNVTLNNPAKVVASASIPANTTCLTTTVITAEGAGGSGGYTYSFNGSTTYTGTKTLSVTLIATAQTITYSVKDSKGCADTKTISIPAYNPPTGINFSPPATITCLATTTSISLTPVAGVAPFTFTIISGATGNTSGDSTGIYTGLLPGNYVFEVKDANGCTKQASTTIGAAATIAVSGAKTDEKCFGANDGTATFTVTGFNTTNNYTVTIKNSLGTSFVGTPNASDKILLTGLAAETYTIVVKDNVTGCSSTPVSVTVAAATKITITGVTASNVNCGQSISNIVVTATGGVTSYKYAYVIAGSGMPAATAFSTANTTINTGVTQSNLSWDVYVMDQNDCPAGPFLRSIIRDASPSVKSPAPAALCFKSPSTTALDLTTFFNLGTGTHTYTVNGTASGSTYNITGSGTYTIIVKDANACTATATYVVKPELTIAATRVKDLDCISDAEITFVASGGTNTYSTYEVQFNGTGLWTAVTSPYKPSVAGDYQFRVTDNAACTAVSNTINVTAKTTPTFNHNETPVSCAGGSNGVINITNPTGIAPFTYLIKKGVTTVSTTATASGLDSGTYDILLTDNKGCTATAQVILANPTALSATVNKTPLSCGTNNATVDATVSVTLPSGGTNTGYQYSFNGGAFSPVFTYSTSIGETVTVTMKDSNNCTQVLTSQVQVIAALNAPKLDPITGTTIYCSPAAKTTSAVTVVATSGTGVVPLAYTIVSGPMTNNTGDADGKYTGLTAGTYVFKVTDANGCTDSQSYIVKPVVNITGSLVSQVDVKCNGASTGSAKITVSGYTGTYTAALTVGTGTVTPTGSTVDVTGLVQGSYTLTLTDGVTGCTNDVVFTITEPAALTLALTSNKNANCNQLLSKVTVTAGGGKAPYSYAYITTATTPLASDYILNKNTADLNTATPTWYVWVKDANGCETALAPVTIAKDTDIAITKPALQCFNGTPFNITLSGSGKAPFIYKVNGTVIPNDIDIVSGLPVDTATYSITASGKYTLSITDANNCSANVDYIVEKQLFATATLNKDITCNPATGASVTVQITNGTAPFSYQVYNGATAVGSPVTGIIASTFTESTLLTTAGNYTFVISDSNSVVCSVTTNIIPVTATKTVDGTFIEANPICATDNTGKLTLTATVGDGPFEFSIDNEVTYIKTNLSSYVFSNLTAGTYECFIKDSRGCVKHVQKTLIDPPKVDFVITPTNMTCLGSSTGKIDVTAVTGAGGTGGTATVGGTGGVFDYYLSNNFGYTDSFHAAIGENHTFSISDYGIYTIKVVDSNGCSTSKQVTLASLIDNLKIDVAPVSDCINGGTAKITVNVAVPSNNYSFAIATSGIAPYAVLATYQPADDILTDPLSSTFISLIPGVTYTFVVKDNSTGCFYLQQATQPITAASLLTSTIDAKNDVTCTGTSTGDVTFTYKDFDATTTDVKYELYDSLTNAAIAGKSGTDNIALLTPPYTHTFSNLPSGKYYIVFTEIGPVVSPTNGCKSASVVFEIKQSDVLLNITASSSKNDNTCSVAGLVTGIAKDGTAPYNYAIAKVGDPLPTSFGSANSFYVDSGNWIVYVKDGFGCIQKSNDVNVGLDPAPSITSVTPSGSCYTGTPINVAVVAGATTMGPITYSVDNGAIIGAYSSVSTFNLTPGSYIFNVKDGNGCVASTTTALVINDQLTLSQTDFKILDCKTSPLKKNGSVTVTALGGNSATYSYTITAPATAIGNISGATSGVFTDLDAGNYIFEVSDGTCTATTTATVDVLNKVTPVAHITPPLCVGADGAVEVTATGGVGSYQYKKGLLGTYSTTNIFSQLASEGTVTYYVKDENECEYPVDATVTNPIPVTIANIATVQMLCGGGNLPTNAKITVTAAGGTTDYEYSFDGGANYSQNNVLTTTIDGIYNIIVRDSNGCTSGAAVSRTINKLDPPMAFIFSNSQMTCPSLATDVTIVASKGVGPLQYEITSPSSVVYPTTVAVATPVTFTGLVAGDYMFKVTDSNGCTSEELYTVPILPALQLTEQVVANVSCKGGSNGNATFTVSNYALPSNYIYTVTSSPALWVSSASNTGISGDVVTLSNLIAGTYSVTITDNTTFCDITKSVTITEPADDLDITAVASNVNCNNSLSDITMSPFGGTPNYTYSIVEAGTGAGTYTAVTSIDTATLTNGVTVGPLTTWSVDVYVKDANGCTDFTTITISKDVAPTIIAPAQQCFVGTDIVINLAPLTTVHTGGTKSYTLDGVDLATSSATFTDAGFYKLGIKDENGCEAFVNYTIEKQLLIDVSLTKDLYCTGAIAATIQVDIQGGKGLYSTQLYSGIAPGGSAVGAPYTTASFVASVSVAGDYYFVTTDSNTPACTVTSTKVTVTTPVNPVIASTPIVEAILCNGGVATMQVNIDPLKGEGPYTYTVTQTAPVAGTPIVQLSNNIFTGLFQGTYDVTVKDGKGCTSAIVTQIISEPAVLTASTTPFAIKTNCDIDTNVKVVAGGGTSPYYYDFGTGYDTVDAITVYDNGTSDQIINYSVKDANGCTVSGSVTVFKLNPPTSDGVTGTTIFCAPAASTTSTVTVKVKAGTGVASLSYTIVSGPTTNTTGATSGQFTGLIAGDYTFKVTDSNGCSYEELYTVKDVVKIDADGQLIAGAACKNDANGKVTFTVSGVGTLGFTHTITGVSAPGAVAQVGNTFELTNLVSGTYQIDVTDTETGCTDTFSVFVPEPAVLGVGYVTLKNATCKLGTTIKATAIDGTPEYTYAFVKAGDPVVYSSSDTAILDPAFSWTVWAKDAHNCETFKAITIITDPMPQIDSVTATQCPSATGYDITVMASSGVGTLEYSLDGISFQSSTNVLKVTSPGNYTVTVRDANKCIITASAPVTILKPLILLGDVSKVRSCSVANDGEITLTAYDGSGNYEYSKDGTTFVSGSLANIFGGFGAGTHTLYVHDLDSSGTVICTKSVDVIIDAPTNVTGMVLTPINVTCKGGNDGSITVALDPSTLTVNNNPNYSFSLTGTTVNGAVTRPNQLTRVFDNLEAGTYTITTTSSRGCQDTKTIAVGESPAIVVPAPVVVQYNCSTSTASNTMNLASITVNNVTGGSRPYFYEFVKGTTIVQSRSTSNVYNQTDLSGGTITVNVYDNKGCLGTAVAAPITPFVSIGFASTAVAIIRPITCAYGEDVQVNVTTTGTAVPMPVLIYDIKDVVGSVYGGVIDRNNTTGAFTGLPIGEYLVTVTNPDTGCSIQQMHYVNNPNTFDVTIDNVVDVTCLNGIDGSAKVTFVDRYTGDGDQAGGFTYTLTDALGNPLPGGTSATAVLSLSGLAAGTYKITAQLSNLPSCPVSKSFTITGPTAALKISKTHTAITCVTGNNDGSISASATGGWFGGYEFQLELSSGTEIKGWSSIADFIGLTAGNYIVKVRDSKGCTDQTAVNLVNPTPIATAITANKTTLSCFGDTDATITVDQPVTGGSSVYNYTLEATYPDGRVTLDGPQSSNVFTNLGAASYKVIVSDTWACSAVTSTLVIKEPNVVTASLVGTSIQTCMSKATVTLSAVGGTGPYTYSDGVNPYASIPSPANTITFSVPFTTVPVDHVYYVKDRNGCMSYSSNSVSVAPLEPLEFEFENDAPYISCFGDNSGQITAIAKGGSGNYIYTLLNSSGNPIIPTPNQPSAGHFVQLAPGDYLMDVTSGDCRIARKPITITQPNSPLIYTPVVTDVTCNGNGDGKLVLTASGGTGIIKYALSPDLDKFVEDGTFLNLEVGLYKAIIQDVRGCNHVYDFEIKEPNPIDAKVDPLSIKQELCAGEKTGEFVVGITGGVGPYSTVLDDPNGTYVLNQVAFTGLSGGNHTVYIKDANSCTSELIVPLDPAVVLNPEAKVSTDCVNDLPANKVTITIDDSNNAADVKYSLDSAGSEQDSNVFTNLTPGDHFIMVHHKNGCVDATDTFTIEDIKPLSLSIELGELNQIVATATGGSGKYQFTLNGEQVSSATKWVYFRSGNYLVTMTDSNGCSISATKYFEFIDIKIPPIFTPTGDGTNDSWKPTNTENYPDIKFVVYDRYGREVGTFGAGQSWDGKYNGTELPMGDYWYVLKLRHSQDDREFIGHFTLYR